MKQNRTKSKDGPYKRNNNFYLFSIFFNFLILPQNILTLKQWGPHIYLSNGIMNWVCKWSDNGAFEPKVFSSISNIIRVKSLKLGGLPITTQAKKCKNFLV